MSETVVTKLDQLGMITVRGDLATIGTATASVTGCALPDMRMASHGADASVLWMSPDELLVVCPYDQAGKFAADLTTALAGAFATVAVVSDARAVFDVQGPQAADAIAKLSPVDFSALAPAEVRRTRMAQVAAAMWAHEDGYRVVCFRSVSDYVEGLLRNAVLEQA